MTVVLYHAFAGKVSEPLGDVVWIGAGVIAGNPLGQRMNRALCEGPLTRLLAAGLLAVAARTAWGALYRIRLLSSQLGSPCPDVASVARLELPRHGGDMTSLWTGSRIAAPNWTSRKP